jgi:hypothetical protein
MFQVCPFSTFFEVVDALFGGVGTKQLTDGGDQVPRVRAG